MSGNSDTCDGRQTIQRRVFEQARAIVAENASMAADEIRLEHRLEEDLGCDSLDLVEITMEVEEQFDISVPDEVAERIKTVKDVVDGVMPFIDRPEQLTER